MSRHLVLAVTLLLSTHALANKGIAISLNAAACALQPGDNRGSCFQNATGINLTNNLYLRETAYYQKVGKQYRVFALNGKFDAGHFAVASTASQFLDKNLIRMVAYDITTSSATNSPIVPDCHTEISAAHDVPGKLKLVIANRGIRCQQ